MFDRLLGTYKNVFSPTRNPGASASQQPPSPQVSTSDPDRVLPRRVMHSIRREAGRQRQRVMNFIRRGQPAQGAQAPSPSNDSVPGFPEKLKALRRLFDEEGMSSTVRGQAKKLGEEFEDACERSEINEGEYAEGMNAIGRLFQNEEAVYPTLQHLDAEERREESWREPSLWQFGEIVSRAATSEGFHQYLGVDGRWHRYDMVDPTNRFTGVPPATPDGEEVWSEDYTARSGATVRVNNQGGIQYLED